MSFIEDDPFSNLMNQKSLNDLNNISKGNNIDLLLMEKDKEIINLSNLNISLKKQMSN